MEMPAIVAHRRLVIVNVFALGVLLFLLLIFGSQLKKSSVSERHNQHRFSRLERKLQKEDSKIRRMIAIKHEVRLLEKEWQHIAQQLKSLSNEGKKVKIMSDQIHKMEKTMKDLSQGLEKEHADRILHEYEEMKRKNNNPPPAYQGYSLMPDDHHRPQGHFQDAAHHEYHPPPHEYHPPPHEEHPPHHHESGNQHVPPVTPHH